MVEVVICKGGAERVQRERAKCEDGLAQVKGRQSLGMNPLSKCTFSFVHGVACILMVLM